MVSRHPIHPDRRSITYNCKFYNVSYRMGFSQADQKRLIGNVLEALGPHYNGVRRSRLHGSVGRWVASAVDTGLWKALDLGWLREEQDRVKGWFRYTLTEEGRLALARYRKTRGSDSGALFSCSKDSARAERASEGISA